VLEDDLVQRRLEMLLWHLAARWGKVTAEGVRLPLRLSHSVLAELTAARRPTVSAALSDMARRGVVLQVDGGWSLVGSPPSDLVELSPVASLPGPDPSAAPRPEAKPRPETQPMPRPAAPASPTPASSPPSAS
jgi:CRP/FNR family transcriptional regulator, cyclic AMP receptor protein